MPTIDVLIVNWNTQRLLAECLSSLAHRVAAGSELTVRVLVVDNGSTDGSVAMLHQCFPQVLVLENATNVGFVSAVNRGLQHVTGDYILLLNTDVVVQPNTLAGLVAILETHPSAGVAGPRLLNPDGSFQASYGRFPTLASSTLSLLGLARRVYGRHYPSAGPAESGNSCPVDWVGGACLLVRARALRDVGPLDPAITMYAEEMDWCYRMQARGWAVLYCAEADLIHLGGGSSHSTREFGLARRWTSQLYFVRKHYGRFYAAILRLILLVISAARAGALLVFAAVRRSRRNALLADARMNLNLLRLRCGYES